MTTPRQVFISYSRRDIKFVERLVGDLQTAGINVWIDQEGLSPGDRNWENSIRTAISESDVLVLVATPDALKSNYVQDEVSIAENNNLRIYPIWANGDKWHDCIPLGMGKIQYVDARGEAYNKGVTDLLQMLTDGNFDAQRFPPETKSGRASISVTQTSEAAPLVISPEILKQAMALHTEKMIGIRYKQKYDPIYYFQRTNVLDHYNNFLTSDKSLMVMTGKAGTGKSTFICDVATHQRGNTLVWLQDCAHLELDDDETISDYIASTLNLPSGFPVLNGFENELLKKDDDTTVVLIFDAVNEQDVPNLLLKKISEFVLHINHDRIKVLVTCRTPIWNALKRFLTVPPHREFHTAGANSFVNIDEFKEDELETIYNKYRDAYNIQSSYASLSDQIKKFIAQPLFLKLMAIAFQKREIPRDLALEQVFDEYVLYCLSRDKAEKHDREAVRESVEYRVLARAIDLMFHHKRRELETALLKSDSMIGDYIDSPEIETPYSRLLDEGILTEKADDVTWKDIRLVFVTYERVFEYLLADMVVSPVTVEKISEMLDISRSNTFIQLRGAAELAMAFAIVNGELTMASVMELAHLDKPDSRQFLCDVIQTIYTSGNRDTAMDIINMLMVDENLPANLLAVQVGYQLKLDDYLIDVVVSKEDDLRNIASLFLYERWNTARLNGNLEDAYKPLRIIAGKIRIRRPIQSIRALSALSFLTFNLLGHIVEDKKSLLPLLEIWQGLARKVPGLEGLPDEQPSNRIATLVLNAFLQVGSQLGSRMLKGTRLEDEAVMSSFWADNRHTRAFMDSPMLHDLDNMVEYKDGVVKLLSWDHPLVRYPTSDPLIHHIYFDPDTHIPMLQDIFDECEEDTFRLRFIILHGFGYALFFRLLRSKDIPEDSIEMLADALIELWYTAHEVDEMTGKLRWEVEGTLEGTFNGSMGLIMLSLFSLEHHAQQKQNKIIGSQILKTFANDPVSENISRESAAMFMSSLERQGYQGSAEFAIRTLLDPDIRAFWEKYCFEETLQSIAQLRSFFQQEIDSIILEDETDEANQMLFNRVRAIGALPNPQDVLFTNTTILILSSAVEGVVTQVVGSLLVDIMLVRSLPELIRRCSRTFVTTIFDFEAINILVAEWYLAHYPDWDRFESMAIDPDVMNRRENVHVYWRQTFAEYIRTHGRGIFFDEL